MGRWIRTKYEGVYLDALAESRGSPAKFVYRAKWHGHQVMRGGFTSASTARDERWKTRAKLIIHEGKIPAARIPAGSDSFKKMVEELVRRGDVRKTMTTTNRPRYSILYTGGTDYALFNLCFRCLAETKKNHFKDGAAVADFAAWLRKTDHSERTLEMCVRLLQKVYGLAVVRGFYPINPVKDAKQSEVLAYQIKKRPGRTRRHPAMRRTLTQEDKLRICEVVRQRKNPALVWVGLNVWLGLRPSVYDRLHLEDFDASRGFLFIRPEAHKSRFFREAGKPSCSILRKETYPILEAYAAKMGMMFTVAAFVDRDGNKLHGSFLPRPISRSAKRRQWRRILKEAGVEYASPYAARHTVINELLSSDIPVQDVATHSGNCPETIFRYYVRPSSEADLRRAAIKWQVHEAAV